MTLADARARVPRLIAHEADPAADRRWLERMAASCDRLTPMVAIDPPDGLVLDMTGCLHLHGGQTGVETAARQAMHALAGDMRLAFAATPEGARALARFRTTPADEAAALRALPVAALGLDPEVARGLRQAGLRTIGDLADRPSRVLTARFGPLATDRLERVLGGCDSRITPRRARSPLRLERRLAEPIATCAAALRMIGELAGEAAAALETRGRGGRRFVVQLHRTDGHVIDLAVDSSRPLRDPDRIRRLFEERVEAVADTLDPGFGFDRIRLRIAHDEPLVPAQLALDGGELRAEALSALVDRLSLRAGRERLRRFVPRDSHVPEQASLALPALGQPSPGPWPPVEPGEPPLRPLHLFDPPQPVEVIAGLPDGPPLRFRWQRRLHDVARAEGPERIGAPWWQRAPGDPGLTRDYYRVEDVGGRRFWLFRHGLYGAERARPRWYLHGLFA